MSCVSYSGHSETQRMSVFSFLLFFFKPSDELNLLPVLHTGPKDWLLSLNRPESQSVKSEFSSDALSKKKMEVG